MASKFKSVPHQPQLTVIHKVLDRLRACFARLEQGPEGPLLDLKWLRLRCEDTLAYSGQLRHDSLRQLKKEVANFVEEFRHHPRCDEVQRLYP